jgi:hypothetical protein
MVFCISTLHFNGLDARYGGKIGEDVETWTNYVINNT